MCQPLSVLASLKQRRFRFPLLFRSSRELSDLLWSREWLWHPFSELVTEPPRSWLGVLLSLQRTVGGRTREPGLLSGLFCLVSVLSKILDLLQETLPELLPVLGPLFFWVISPWLVWCCLKCLFLLPHFLWCIVSPYCSVPFRVMSVYHHILVIQCQLQFKSHSVFL